MSANSSASSASRDGIGMPPSPLCAGEVEVANPIAPARMPSTTMRAHPRDLLGRRGALRGLLAHDEGAHARVPDERGDVETEPGPLERAQVLREALELPADAGAQRLERHALDVGEVAHRQVAVLAGGTARW